MGSSPHDAIESINTFLKTQKIRLQRQIIRDEGKRTEI